SNGLFAKLRQPLYQTGIAGVFYFMWALGDLTLMQDLPGITQGDVVLAALFRIIAVIVPTALLVFRKGYVSAGVLVALALFLAVGQFGVGEDEAGFGHIIYAAIFARGAWIAWKQRKRQS
ncbi:MAG: hypothetical protein AAF986_08435, partial [Pseudomonadota bacterium]